MQYVLKNVITAGARYTQNQDGTITASNVRVVVGIIGAPEGKFLQGEVVMDASTPPKPEIIVPANTAAADMQTYITTQAQAYVTRVYPNS